MNVLNQDTHTKKANNYLGWITFLTILGFLFTPFPKSVASNENTNTDSEQNTTVLFQPPPEEAQPKKTEGAASRQNKICSQDLLSRQQSNSDRSNLRAVVPDRNYGLTTTERPTFWFYLPVTSARQAILSIQEDGITPHWQQSINLTGETGIVGIKPSPNAPALEIGKSYQWAVILVCGDRPNPNDPVITAWIERIDESQISHYGSPINTKGLAKAAWYARQGIWHNALDLLAEQKLSWDNGNDIWVKYLQSGGLAEIANEPVISNQ